MEISPQVKHRYNRLIEQKSPYLLQHADNPVDWYPWSEEAFEKAKRDNKPVFLSIGYSTCHWCHVMARESFQDEQVAEILNKDFISVKVDREERPDIDQLYMTACQMITGNGGWPLTLVLTPDKKPFFAGTYIPKYSRAGRIGIIQLLPRITEIWEKRHDDVESDAIMITKALVEVNTTIPGKDPTTQILKKGFSSLVGRYDSINGGFGSAPKFPTPQNILFLLRYWKHHLEPEALQMVENTLTQMRRGGIWDHLGYGFHRYSTDAKWLIPHFEKMLYDQALLIIAYLEAFQATGKTEYGETARQILDYVLRDMQSTGGGFFAAEDADSEGEEGKYYLWTYQEVKDLLGADAEFAIRVFNIREDGNYFDEVTGRKSGKNILHLSKPVEDIANDMGMGIYDFNHKFEEIRQRFFDERRRRYSLHIDDKILTDWNGLMIAALARATQVLDNQDYIQAARRAIDFIFSKMRPSTGKLFHRYRDGDAAFEGILNDYAFMIFGLIEMYEATFDASFLASALELNNTLIENYTDEKGGGFYLTSKTLNDLPARPKDSFDVSVPSGNSVQMLNLLRLSRITANSELEKKALSIGRSFVKIVEDSPSAHAFMLVSIDFALSPNYEVVLAGNLQNEDTQMMLRVLRSQFIPNKVTLLNPDSQEEPEIIRFASFVREMKPIDNRSTIYICDSFSCKSPTYEIDRAIEILNDKEKKEQL